MSRLFGIIVLGIIVFLLSCTPEDSVDYHSKSGMDEIERDTIVDKISGYSPDDLLKVFTEEVYCITDSVFSYCIRQILSESQESDFNSEMILIEQTVNIINYKYDKLEKFHIFEVDDNCKSMMLRFLDQQSYMLQNYCSEIVRLKYASESDNNTEQNHYELIESLRRKEREQNKLLDEIFKEYFEHHDKT